MNSLATVLTLATAALFNPVRADESNPVTMLAGNAFGFDVYGRLCHKDGNLFFSPFSISTALAMTSAGARGETAKQMDKVLHLGADPAKAQAAYGLLVRNLTKSRQGDHLQLRVANALWTQKGFNLLPGFIEQTKSEYGAGLRSVDFNDAAAACKIINSWVEDQTQDKIKDLIRPGMIQPPPELILTNAIYFKGAWQSPFHEQATREQEFHVTSNEAVKAPMMRQTHEFRYFENESLQALELPYRGGTSMLVFLPRLKDGLSKLEEQLDNDKLGTILREMRRRRVEVELPRFKVESQFQLADVLKQLGMTLPFSAQADFSGISASSKLIISDVVHKAFVDVNEKGTEAAAATAVIVVRAAAPAGQPISFHADHPFIYLIRDHESGAILFHGRVVNPKG
jgi:serpin B